MKNTIMKTMKWIGITFAAFFALIVILLIVDISNDDEQELAAIEEVNEAPVEEAAPEEEPIEEAAPEEAPVEEEAPAEETYIDGAKAVAPFNIIHSLNEAEVKEAIKTAANADWGTDFEMVQYQIENQTTAFNELKALTIDTDMKEILLIEALEEWGTDFEMVQYQYDNQLQAYNELQ